MDGLIIKKYWLNKILSYEKNIELRGQRTKKIGHRIYLLSNGFVYGTAIISDCLELDEYTYESYRNWRNLGGGHRVGWDYNYAKTIYPHLYAWFLKDVQTIEPKPYKHPHGAVIWIKNVEFEEI